MDKRLSKDPELKDQYASALSALENQGIFEEVPHDQINSEDHPIFYLPHKPVLKESSSTTKVRLVFDASATCLNGVSLNSCMNTGPYLTGNLLEVLLRFRRWKYALSSDITKAFFQIQVNDVDRDVHRFLWKKDGSIRIMRIIRLPFGNTASPFLLNATIKFHLEQQPPSRAVEELISNVYVDDWLTGVDTKQDLLELKSEAKAIMDKAGMPLTKWCTNSTEVADHSAQIFKEKDTEFEQHKVLGIIWIPEQDCFSFSETDFFFHSLVATKRVILSLVSMIFDPMGLLRPFVMVAKFIFQSLWRLGLQWDDIIPETEEKKFLKWREQLTRINEFSVPRSFVKNSWEQKRDVELHSFSDESEKGYGACVSLRVTEEDGSVCSSLVLSKARLAPIKKVTLPRLELMGALLSPRLVTYVRKTLMLPDCTKYMCWTDSTVALQWIKSDSSKWKTFVANRVSEIQELTSPDSWNHCRGFDNPTDILFLGSNAEFTNQFKFLVAWSAMVNQ